jgi:GDP-4-dehydro-6-deoxy-D-mannose reductase
MRILVTGADGFVGSRLVPELLERGHDVGAAVLPGAPNTMQARRGALPDGAIIRDLNLLDARSVESLAKGGWDAVVHLAAATSGAEASRNPIAAWEVNVLGTVRLCESLGRLHTEGADPLFLLVSSAEVYGAGSRVARVETDEARPRSAYAASKLAAETAVLEVCRRTGLRVIVARPFPHTGAGQDDRFVVPAFVKRVLEAKRNQISSIEVGNLDPVRDFLHVDDVVDAYCSLIDSGIAGEIYNVASGAGVSISDILTMVVAAVEHDVQTEVNPELVRPADVPFLVGDSSKLRIRAGWKPKLSLEQAIREVVDAQTD